MKKAKDSVCCSYSCNQGRTCPVRLGTYKPAEAVHRIAEPQAEALSLAGVLRGIKRIFTPSQVNELEACENAAQAKQGDQK